MKSIDIFSTNVYWNFPAVASTPNVTIQYTWDGTNQECVMAMGTVNHNHATKSWRHRRSHGTGCQIYHPLAIRPRTCDPLRWTFAYQQTIARTPDVFLSRWSISNRLQKKDTCFNNIAWHCYVTTWGAKMYILWLQDIECTLQHADPFFQLYLSWLDKRDMWPWDFHCSEQECKLEVIHRVQ